MTDSSPACETKRAETKNETNEAIKLGGQGERQLPFRDEVCPELKKYVDMARSIDARCAEFVRWYTLPERTQLPTHIPIVDEKGQDLVQFSNTNCFDRAREFTRTFCADEKSSLVNCDAIRNALMKPPSDPCMMRFELRSDQDRSGHAWLLCFQGQSTRPIQWQVIQAYENVSGLDYGPVLDVKQATALVDLLDSGGPSLHLVKLLRLPRQPKFSAIHTLTCHLFKKPVFSLKPRRPSKKAMVQAAGLGVFIGLALQLLGTIVGSWRSPRPARLPA